MSVGKILKAVGLFLVRLLTFFVLLVVIMAAIGAVASSFGQESMPKFMTLVTVPMLPLLFACFAAKNPIRVRAWAACKSIFVAGALAFFWLLLQPSMEVAGPSIEMPNLQDMMVTQMGAMIFMYLSGFLMIIWTPSLAVQGSSPPPDQLYKFEKVFLVFGLVVGVFSYLMYEASIEMVSSSPLATKQQIEFMSSMPAAFSAALGTGSMIFLTLCLTRGRLIIFRTLFLISAIFMIPGLVMNSFIFQVPWMLWAGGLISSALLFYGVWLLYTQPLSGWAQEARQGFLDQQELMQGGER